MLGDCPQGHETDTFRGRYGQLSEWMRGRGFVGTELARYVRQVTILARVVEQAYEQDREKRGVRRAISPRMASLPVGTPNRGRNGR